MSAATVRAKFFVQEVTHTTYGGRVTLSAVCRGEDNKAWAAATPAGQIQMTINNDLALEVFKPGEEFFLDFTPAPKNQPGMGDATG